MTRKYNVFRPVLLFLISVLFICSLSAVSSANFDNVNGTTDNIQNAINNNDTEIILDGSRGSFNNLSTIYINKSGVKITGTNNAVINRNTSTTGDLILFNISARYVIIENLTINGYYNGIYSNTGDLTITNNKINTTNTAIQIYDSNNFINFENIKITKNQITANGRGINLYTYPGNITNGVFSANNITTTGDGIYLYSHYNTNITVLANTLISSNDGVYIHSYHDNTNITVSSNNIKANGKAVYLNTYVNSSNNIVSSNNIITNGTGILIATNDYRNNTIVSDNNITTKNVGIYFSGCRGSSNSIISSNNVISYRTGIYLNMGYDVNFNNIVSSNNIISNGTGIDFRSSSNRIPNYIVSANNITSNGNGIYLELRNNTNTIVSFNNIISNGTGIYVNGSYIMNTTVSANNIKATDYGIFLNASADIIDNAIFGNSIFGNGSAILVNGTKISGLNVSYNRILVNGSYYMVLNTTGENNSVFANWFGTNNPDMAKIVNVTMKNWVIVNLKSVSDKVFVGDKAQFKYTIGLSDGSNFDSSKLPYFTFTVDGKSYDARLNKTFTNMYNTSGLKKFSFAVDDQLLNDNVSVVNKKPTNILNNVVTETITVNNLGSKLSKLRYGFQNFGDIKGSKTFTLKVNNKYVLTGLKVSSNVRYSYNKNTRVLKLLISNLNSDESTSVKLGIKRINNVVTGKNQRLSKYTYTNYNSNIVNKNYKINTPKTYKINNIKVKNVNNYSIDSNAVYSNSTSLKTNQQTQTFVYSKKI